MTDDHTYNTESLHTPESRERDARLVGHEWKGEAIGDDPKCEAGCISYYGGEKKHHKDCPYYPESLTKLNADRIEALLAERDARLVGHEPKGSKMAKSSFHAEGLDTHSMLISVPRWRVTIGGGNGFEMILSQTHPDHPVTAPNRMQRWFLRVFFCMDWQQVGRQDDQ